MHFLYNPDNIKNEEVEKMVAKYTKDWNHNNDWSEVSFHVSGLTDQQAKDLKTDLKREGYFYEIEIDQE